MLCYYITKCITRRSIVIILHFTFQQGGFVIVLEVRRFLSTALALWMFERSDRCRVVLDARIELHWSTLPLRARRYNVFSFTQRRRIIFK